MSHANRNWFTATCLSYLISSSEWCKLFWTCSLFVGVTMISMATERSASQTICAITTMAVATQRYVNLKCFCFRKSNDLFLKLIFTVLFKLYIQIKSFIYISTKKISRGWSHDQDQSITILRPSFCWFLGQTKTTKCSWFPFRLIVLLWPLVSITARVREGMPGTGCSVSLPSTN